jgi:tRNA A-37 threonylcarbamoyl transferase component Bud32
MNVPSFSFSHSETTAAASITKKGEEIYAGKKTTRLQIGNDPRFNIAVKVINENSSWLDLIKTHLGKAFGYYVKLNSAADKEEKESIYINVSSFANRLHIRKNVIYEEANKGSLSSLIQQKAEIAQSKISGYEKVVKKFEEAKTGYTSKSLMKIIRTAYLTEGFIYHPIIIQKPGQNTLTYYGRFDKDKKRIELATLSSVFADGAFGEIREFSVEGRTEVFKQARKSVGKRAREDIKNEYERLIEIHGRGKVWGIQAPPRKVIQIKENSSVTQYGYIGIKYDGDYFKEIRKDSSKLKDQLMDFHQLLWGLKELAKQDILHGDLKPENILVKKENDGTRTVHIADLGGAKVAKPSQMSVISNNLLWDLWGGNRALSPGYSSHRDLAGSEKLLKGGEYEEFVKQEKKRDVFSMGCILYIALTKKNPYPTKKREFLRQKNVSFLNTGGRYREIKENVPKEIKDLIKEMVDPDYIKRPTAQEAFDKYDKFLQEQYPEIRQRIHKQMKSEGYLPP